ncbi:MAG TPA: ROK family transcriptional regulator [Streptosporangiaceae bacterium]|nr:ROK family transcriptional regulator [Streptosporangiaceae bacterium]
MPERRRWTVRDLRRDNRSVLLWSLYVDQPCSRQDLSEATGLSSASVSNVIRELIAEGIVVEAGSVDSDGGRPRVLLRINPDYGYVVGVDVGETRVRAELFDLTMTVRANADYPFEPREHGVDVVVDRILTCLRTVLADSGVAPEAILGVGIGVPGVVEHGPETLLFAQTYGWDAVPLERLLRAGTDLPLFIENGANTLGQAELWFGAGQGARHGVVCLIGSGVGASIIGHGASERAGTSAGTEWGHTTIMVGGRDCRCGSLGCLEAYVGAEAILDRYGQSSGPMLPDGDEESALAALVDLAETSPEAAHVLDETALYLGAGIADLINLFGPDQIILGGWAGLLLGRRLLPAIRSSAHEHALSHAFAKTTISVGRIGPDAVARGAATLPVQAFLNGTAVPAARRGEGAGRDGIGSRGDVAGHAS